MSGSEVLDNAPWWSMRGVHAPLAELRGLAGRYAPDVSPFAAVTDYPERAAWDDLAELVGPGQVVVMFRSPVLLPDNWPVQHRGVALQLIGDGLEETADADAAVLGSDDVAEMLDLVARTRPGPFLRRTVELGTYLGLRHEGRLVAMAGERLRPPGWSEISAVCTDPAYRGRRLATRLIRAVAWGIRQRGEMPFLHVAEDNTTAIRLYKELGFSVRRDIAVVVAQSPS